MGIKIGLKKTVEVEATFIRLHAKVCDSGSYDLLDKDGQMIANLDNDYVPNKIIPGKSGDYIDLKIELSTGKIVNWTTPTARDIQEAFANNEA